METDESNEQQELDEEVDERGPKHPFWYTKDVTRYRADIMLAIQALNNHPKNNLINGLDILRYLQEAYDDPNMSHARLYPNLDWLEERGYLIQHGQVGIERNWQLSDKGLHTLINRKNTIDAHVKGKVRKN